MFTISQKSLSELAAVARLSKTDFVYSGNFMEPGLYIAGLEQGKDYDVSYENNRDVGSAAAIASGKGNYTGSLSLPFTIAEKQPADTISDAEKDEETRGDKENNIGNPSGNKTDDTREKDPVKQQNPTAATAQNSGAGEETKSDQATAGHGEAKTGHATSGDTGTKQTAGAGETKQNTGSAGTKQQSTGSGKQGTGSEGNTVTNENAGSGSSGQAWQSGQYGSGYYGYGFSAAGENETDLLAPGANNTDGTDAEEADWDFGEAKAQKEKGSESVEDEETEGDKDDEGDREERLKSRVAASGENSSYTDGAAEDTDGNGAEAGSFPLAAGLACAAAALAGVRVMVYLAGKKRKKEEDT